MLIQTEDINTYKSREVSGELIISQITKLHKPTGVFFNLNKNEATDEFLYFKVAAIDSKGEIQDSKTFDGVSSKSFFEAVDYFEKLINDRIPQQENKQPSVGKFFFVKEMDSVVKLTMFSDETIVIDREDLDKVFSPPKKKPYGRLNMFAVEKEKYDAIKSKFALKYNEEETKLFLEQSGIEEGKAIVYDMTPYSTDEKDQDGEPSDVNDDQLSLDKIEDENPEDLKGEKQESQEGEKSEDSKDESTDEQQQSDQSDQSDEQPQDGEESDEHSDEQDQETDETDETDEQDQESDESDDTKKNKLAENQDEQESESEKTVVSSSGEGVDIAQDARERLSQFMGVEDVVYSYRRQSRMLDTLNSLPEETLKNNVYPIFNIDRSTPKFEFLNTVQSITKSYFE